MKMLPKMKNGVVPKGKKWFYEFQLLENQYLSFENKDKRINFLILQYLKLKVSFYFDYFYRLKFSFKTNKNDQKIIFNYFLTMHALLLFYI